MNKIEFIKQLKTTAATLEPLTKSTSLGQKVWNGKEYADVKAGEEKKPDPYALAWLSTLLTIAELIEGQESPLSPKQINYLDNLLFGGMGSLNDLWFDETTSDASADMVNQRLNAQRNALFASFKKS